MSLSDTVFIFVLALIIFGPKKLPEIGRQIGRLVGEFRRASNEFKFQIDEEMRQLEREDEKKTIASADATLTPAIEPPSTQESLPAITPAAGTQSRGAFDSGCTEAEEPLAGGEPFQEDSSAPDNPDTIPKPSAFENTQSPVEVESARG